MAAQQKGTSQKSLRSSGLQLPPLRGQVLSTLLSLCHRNRGAAEQREEGASVIVGNHLLSFLEALSPEVLNSPFIFTLMVPSSAFSSSSLPPSVPFFLHLFLISHSCFLDSFQPCLAIPLSVPPPRLSAPTAPFISP